MKGKSYSGHNLFTGCAVLAIILNLHCQFIFVDKFIKKAASYDVRIGGGRGHEKADKVREVA